MYFKNLGAYIYIIIIYCVPVHQIHIQELVSNSHIFNGTRSNGGCIILNFVEFFAYMSKDNWTLKILEEVKIFLELTIGFHMYMYILIYN